MGDKIFFPNSQQFDRMNENLEKIAKAVGSQVDISTWGGIQKAVRAGIASDILPVGTQLLVKHSVYGDHLYDVVAHDYLKSVHDENAHTMTLMCHDIVGIAQYDSPEAFYYAENELPAGAYNFTIASAYNTWGVGTYQFTLTKTLPKGSQLCMSGNATVSLTDLSVVTYDSSTTTTATETVAITSGNGGTNLGTLGVELNHPHRVSHGSDNYKESAIRQLLNSSAEAGSVWTPQTKYDRPPNWVTTATGFVNGLDVDFLSVIGNVVVPCSANDIYESPDSATKKGAKYTVKDKFYISSQKETYGTELETVSDDSMMFPFYKGATDADRIKYRNDSAAQYWLRTANTLSAAIVNYVRSDGSMGARGVYIDQGYVPICTIV